MKLNFFNGREKNTINNLKVFSLVFLFLISFSLVSSDKPTTQIGINQDVGLEIQYPKYTFVPQASEFTLHTHVFNKSNGLPVLNDTINCNLHLYDSNGNHSMKQKMDFGGVEWEVPIKSGNFSNIGLHAYLITCNDSQIGGFVSGVFQVTPSQNLVPQGFYFLVILLLYVVSFVGFFGKSEIITLFGGFGMTFLGLYLIANGIADFRGNLTLAISYITIGLGAYFSLASALALMEGD